MKRIICQHFRKDNEVEIINNILIKKGILNNMSNII
ncbi:hypothetical protein CLVI_05620 [Clostridium vincentii]|uniref:Uncharacterized protein n=1 Tax=Clostridium vincentii TaxID=52704 RepID=A0A2T0BJ31_9CLOT|nr:hypothetical protein CLVI_05620 [Clostridium vincentii]